MTLPTKDSSSLGALPNYNTPPVDEVVCGVRFQTPDKFRIPHIGLLWDRFRSNYPIIQHAPPLASTQGEIVIDAKSGVPVPRIWFINEMDDQLIQFQVDRFYFNWRRKKNAYPRYPHVIGKFEETWDTITNFFKEFELGELKPKECELSYINHIPRGEAWDSIEDLPKIFTDFIWNKRSGRFLTNPEDIAWQTNFKMPKNMGSLNVNIKKAIRADDQTPLIVFNLTVRGAIETNDKKIIREWFDLAHEWIVRGFTDLTTPNIQTTIWKREENA